MNLVAEVLNIRIFSFIVESKAIYFAFHEWLQVHFRVRHHQMAIKMRIRQFFPQARYNRCPYGQVVHEMTSLWEWYPSIISM